MSKIAVVYWSGTGNTEKMAEKVLEPLAVITLKIRIHHPVMAVKQIFL